MAAPKRNKPEPARTLGNRLSRQSGGNGFLQQMPLTGDLQDVRKRILDYGAEAEFEMLAKGNCDPLLLLCSLAEVAKDGPEMDTWEARFGCDRRQLPSVIANMRLCANQFELLDKNHFFRMAAWPSFKNEYAPPQFLSCLSSIPVWLRRCADSLESVLKKPQFKPRRRLFSNIALAQLAAYVEHCTGAPQDNEVSALVNAVRKSGEDRPYTPDALKTWRAEHADAILHASQLLPSLFGR